LSTVLVKCTDCNMCDCVQVTHTGPKYTSREWSKFQRRSNTCDWENGLCMVLWEMKRKSHSTLGTKHELSTLLGKKFKQITETRVQGKTVL
jgi:hypothetical protein